MSQSKNTKTNNTNSSRRLIVSARALSLVGGVFGVAFGLVGCNAVDRAVQTCQQQYAGAAQGLAGACQAGARSIYQIEVQQGLQGLSTANAQTRTSTAQALCNSYVLPQARIANSPANVASCAHGLGLLLTNVGPRAPVQTPSDVLGYDLVRGPGGQPVNVRGQSSAAAVQSTQATQPTTPSTTTTPRSNRGTIARAEVLPLEAYGQRIEQAASRRDGPAGNSEF